MIQETKEISNGVKDKILISLAIGLVLLVAITLFLSWQWYFGTGPLKLTVSTDKTEYDPGSVLKVVIQNNSRKNICFSSCYPYYLEKKDVNFQSYPYPDCPKPNLSEPCVKPRQSKFFEIDLPLLEAGLHRLAIPVCVDCKIKEDFREDTRFYSNEFTIK
jgi:hypothetical protein